MTYLLDTNVLSELRKVRTGRCNAEVARWAAGANPTAMFISAITILELERGALLVGRRDPKQAEMLKLWLENQVKTVFDGRILAVDADVARRCAALGVPDPKPIFDSLIAATALVHAMTVVTRNVVDFEAMGVAILNPWIETSTPRR